MKIATSLLCLLLALAAVFALASCGGTPAETEAQTEPATEPVAESETEPATETAETEDPYLPEASKYHDPAMWSFCEFEKNTNVDTFFLVPTAVAGDFTNMPTNDAELVEKYNLQVGNQKGIYDDCTRFFAPVYAQMTLDCYLMTEEERAPYAAIAYEDVRAAFEYYLHVWNGGNPIVLAGSSQGAEMLMKLLADFFNTEEAAEKLVCCYAIGWCVTEEDMAALPFVHFATGEDDLRAVVSFNSEAPEITSSLIVGEQDKALCINPLNWSRDPSPVAKEANLGCCIYSTKGYQKGEDLVGFCGAYIDDLRGTLKVTDVDDPDASLYPSRIDGQPYGVYHIYDWEFFYRNLEANVQTRVAAYFASHVASVEP